MEFINKIQIIQTPIQLATKILLPFSFLSAILSYTFFCNFQRLAYGLQILGLSDVKIKNCMFLLCNGLLVFVATRSGLMGRVEFDIKVERTFQLVSFMPIKKIQMIGKGVSQRALSHPIHLIAKVLLSFSLLSVILSYPFLCNYQSLAYGLQIIGLSDVKSKNCMFLLCNGLLVFIATSSGLMGSFRVQSDVKVETTLKISKGDSQRELEVESSEPRGSILKEKVTAEVPLVHVEDKGEDDGTNEVVPVDEDDGINEVVPVDEDEEIGLMSNEELNKKCEEFIRKMKQGIKFEAGN